MQKYQVSVKQICQQLDKYNLLKNYSIDAEDFIIENISYNSKEMGNNALFFCKGVQFKKGYLLDAVKNGARVYMSEVDYEIDEAFCIIVKDIRKAMSIAAQTFYDFPEHNLNLVGLTGTKGKTTTTYYIKSILDNFLTYKSAVLSTVETYTGTISLESHFSTPESVDLQRFFSEARDNNIEYLTMEVSSLGCKLGRVYGVNFDIGIFLNIDEDHIGSFEHTDYNDYFTSKLLLMENCKTAIINADCAEFEKIYQTAKNHAEKVIVLGDGGDYFVQNIVKQQVGFTFDVCDKNGNKSNFAISQEGRFNISNALVAIAVAKEFRISNEIIKKGIQDVSIKGRMNVFSNDKIKVIVDYAHNHLSFEQIFKSFKTDYPDSKITVVCGCPGDRAYLRRRDIGTLCGQYADMIYLTEDDPGHEEVVDICQQIAGYIKVFDKQYEICPNRTVAIERAILNAIQDEIIIVAGKGEEVYQKVKGKFVYYESDLTIVKRMLDN